MRASFKLTMYNGVCQELVLRSLATSNPLENDTKTSETKMNI